MIEVPFKIAETDTRVFYRLGEEDFISQIDLTGHRKTLISSGSIKMPAKIFWHSREIAWERILPLVFDRFENHRS